MACFLMAAKALKEAGMVLKGDLILTAVVGEIEWEPVDEYLPADFASHDVGCRYMVSRGVLADYALVAENTQLGFGPLEAGKCLFKVTVYGGPSLYVPYLNRPYEVSQNPNAIVKTAKLVEQLEAWALAYENANIYESEWGRMVPKVNIGAIRGGAPYFPSVSPEICSLYMDVRTAPAQDPLAVKESLERLLESLGLEGEVELYLHRRGYEAQGIGPLHESVERSHRRVLRRDLKRVSGPRASMWRDTNVFNEAGIPAASYGPGAGRGHGGVPALGVDDLVVASKVYALTAMDLCNQETYRNCME
jgi:acetylornithine deacetylase/succinyl-diaminopimelate desuccinylase-like protein